MRQDEGRLIRSYAVAHGPGPVRFPQDPRWHQFVHARTGVVRIETDEGSWTLPSDRGLWIAAGVTHRADVVQRADMRTLYLPEREPLLDDRIAVVEMTPLTRETVAHLVRIAPVVIDHVGRAWLTVLREQVRALDVAPVDLPAVRAEPAATVARALRADPGTDRSIDELAHAANASRRTIERDFRAATGLSVGEWRRRLRVLLALEQLAAGVPVGRVAVDAGYATQSAFGAMFRAELGTSPGRYFSNDR